MSDGYQNYLMTMVNVVFKEIYPGYTAPVISRVANALLIGMITGQVVVGMLCDRIGRRAAMLSTTVFVVLGSVLGSVSGLGFSDLFWMLTVARGIVGFGAGGEYPTSSTTAGEATHEHVSKAGPGPSSSRLICPCASVSLSPSSCSSPA